MDAGYENMTIPTTAVTINHEDSSPFIGIGESGALSFGIVGEFHPFA